MIGVDQFIEVCVIAEGEVKQEDIEEEIEEDTDEFDFKGTYDLKTVDSIKEWLLDTDLYQMDVRTNNIKPTQSENQDCELTQPPQKSRKSYVSCTYCKHTIMSSTYQLHVWENHGKLIHGNICTKCNELFASKTIFKCHMRDKHSGQLTRENICTKCNKVFASKRSLGCHVNEMHSEVVIRIPCPDCGRIFSRKPNMKAHRESMHLGKEFPCNICNIKFHNISSQRRHRIKNH